MTQVVIDAGKLREFMASPQAPVMRYLAVVGEIVKTRTIASLKSGFPQQFLGPSIVKRMEARTDGAHVLVGSSRLQTSAHPIDPRGHPYLAFKSAKAPSGIRRLPDGRVLVRHVNHPGSNFAKYLTERLTKTIATIHVG